MYVILVYNLLVLYRSTIMYGVNRYFPGSDKYTGCLLLHCYVRNLFFLKINRDCSPPALPPPPLSDG